MIPATERDTRYKDIRYKKGIIVTDEKIKR
jgi:hypothetical protein